MGAPNPDQLFDQFLDRHPKPTEEDFERLVARHPEHEVVLRTRWKDQKAKDVVEGVLRAARVGRQNEPDAGSNQDRERGTPSPGTEEHADHDILEELLGDLLAEVLEHTSQVARYEKEQDVSHGGLGAITSSRDAVLGRRVALKRVLQRHDERRELTLRFLDEARLCAQLRHPGIVPVHELGIDKDGRPYFTMRLVAGDRLRLDQDSSTLPETVERLIKVCETVAYAHARGVVHRDLKPGNILVGAFGEVYVIDWGLAKAGYSVTKNEEPTTVVAMSRPDDLEGSLGQLGSPDYMAPEQASLQHDLIGPSSDVYAIGAMIYEALAGHPPYRPEGVLLTPYQVMALVRNGPPRPLREFARATPVGLVRISEQAMARDVGARPTALQLGQELAQWLTRKEVKAVPRLLKWIARLGRRPGSPVEAGASPNIKSVGLPSVHLPNQRSKDDTWQSVAEDATVVFRPVTPEDACERRRAVLSTLVPWTGRFEDLGVFEMGETAVVSRARDQLLKRDVAIKRMQEANTHDRLIEEAQITAQLDHPGIPAVHELGIGTEGDPFVVMDFVQGDTLDQRFKDLQNTREKAMLPHLIEVVGRVCDTLAYAHRKGIVHCNISPSNILVGHFGQVYVMGWGACEVDIDPDADAPVSLLRRDSRHPYFKGTPEFAALEQAEGKVSPRTDVFGVAATFYTTVVGFLRPHRVPPRRHSLRRYLSQPIVPLRRVAPWLPRNLTRVIDSALAPNPAHRSDSVEVLSYQLRSTIRQ